MIKQIKQSELTYIYFVYNGTILEFLHGVLDYFSVHAV